MAIVTFGPIVTAVAGSVAGVTFQRAGGQDIARRRPHPPRPGAFLQRGTQANLAAASSLWPELSSVTKALWVAWAATVNLTNSLFKTYHPTGQQAFMMCVTLQLHMGLPVDTSAVPSAPGLAAEITPTLGVDTDNLEVSAFSPDPAAHIPILYTAYCADVRRAHNRMPWLAYTLAYGDDAFPIVIGFNIHGSLATGSLARIWVMSKHFDIDLRPSLNYWYFLDWTV